MAKKTKADLRIHPDAKAWFAWLETDEGKIACSGVASGEYLRNRLHHAFKAGLYAARRIEIRELPARKGKR